MDPDALAFGPSARRWHTCKVLITDDLNDDGLTDLLGHYRTRETGIAFGDTETWLTGQIDGTLFEACDDIRPVP